MKYLLVLVFCLWVGWLFPSVEISNDDGWVFSVRLSNLNSLKRPLILMIDNNVDTNTEFLLKEDDFKGKRIGLSDGYYLYQLFSPDKNLIEKSNFMLYSPFSVDLIRTASESSEIIIITSTNLFVELYLYSQGSIVEYLRLPVISNTSVTFSKLKPSTEYRVFCKTDNFSKSLFLITKKKNTSLNKPISGTFNRLPESRFMDDSTPAITRINDGRIEWYSGMAVSENINTRDQMVFIDLLQLIKISSIVVTWNANYYPYRYFFIYSKDGKKWESLERTDRNYIGKIALENSPVKADFINTNIEASFIGIVVKKSEKIFCKYPMRNYVELMEIESYD